MSNTMDASHAQALLAYAMLEGQDARLERLASPRGPLSGVGAACFLLFRYSGEHHDLCDASRFAFDISPALVHQLSRSTQPQREEWQGRVRGRVDWGATYKERAGHSTGVPLYVCRRHERDYDRPENELLRYLLAALERDLDRVPPEMWNWCSGAGFRAGEPVGSGGTLRMGVELGRLRSRARALSGHVLLRQIPLPERVGEEHLRAARSSRNHLHRALVPFHALHRDAVEAPRADTYRRLLRHTLPLPPQAVALVGLPSR